MSDNWGIGAALQLDYASLELDEPHHGAGPLTLTALSLQFSATYN